MSEGQSESEGRVVSETPAEVVQAVQPDPGGEPVVAPPARKRPRRGRVAAVAGAVLTVGALVAGVGITVGTVRDADRDAGAPVWKFPADKAGEEKAPSASGLAGMLVPYGTDGWVQGPDIGEFGSDTRLSAAQATAMRKESLRDLPRSQRRQLEKHADRLRIKGMAMRSYFSAYGSGLQQDLVEDIYNVSVTLTQLENRTAVRDASRFQTELLGTLEIFRDGPTVKGHKDAKCFLSPKELSEDLDSMFCSGYVGDVLVTLSADGARPLDSKGVAMLLSTQLDRIAEPGEAV
ncbi:hypothetical protein [Streptomyces chartreusis]|uniref:hypothetical protein n=1 Tax=Streptomyces chartreusis TaxID=1969 RepID=UPI00364ABB4F